jgi:hypothetical protein
MVELWDDDERAPHKMPKNEGYSDRDEEVVPIWKILKEYYDEEKESMYMRDHSPSRSYNMYNTYNYDRPVSEDELSEHYVSDDEYSEEAIHEEENVVLDEDIPEDIPERMKEIGDIIEKEIYKKFSYI